MSKRLSSLTTSGLSTTAASHLCFSQCSSFNQLAYLPEASEVFGISNRRQIVRWKYNPSAALVNLQGHKGPAETIAVSSCMVDSVHSFDSYDVLQQTKARTRRSREARTARLSSGSGGKSTTLSTPTKATPAMSMTRHLSTRTTFTS